MTMLARKISRGKWATKEYLPKNSVRADAVTDLKTTNDALSMWRCENDQDVDEVFLALATGTQNKGLDTMDVVVIPQKELEKAGLVSDARDGDTAVSDLKPRHVDLVRLDLEQLGQIAHMLADRVNRDEVCRRTEGQIKRLVRDAVSAGRLRLDDLSKELRDQLSPPTVS